MPAEHLSRKREIHLERLIDPSLLCEFAYINGEWCRQCGIFQEETFGPVAAVAPFDDEEETPVPARDTEVKYVCRDYP